VSLRSARPLLLGAALFATSILADAANILLERPASISPRVEYGIERLDSAVSKAGHRLLRGPEAVGVDFTVSLVNIEPGHEGSLPSEGYRLARHGKGHIELLASDDSGLLYGLLDLSKRLGVVELPQGELHVSEYPALRLRGPCIGMQKTYILPGYHVYEYPYREDLFPFFYDKEGWVRYLDFLADNRMNSLYLWNGHPFASLVKLPEYPYALEVTEEQFQRNVEMFRFIAKEADRRGIWVVQMFYSIILSKPFAEKNGIATQLAAPTPLANDYMRKSIAAFVRDYPNVGLMACLGEALQGIDNQVSFCNDVILAGVKDGMAAAGLTKEPPVVIRTHATDPRVVMPSALKHYSNLYTEAKFNGESLTTWEPRGTWQGIHQDMAKLGSTHIANVHILANLEPFRYGAQRFIRKSVLAMRDRLGARALHLYPLAYWNWPDSPDITPSPLPQVERDWIWFEAWARYAWNPDIDEATDKAYWIDRLTERFGSREAAEHILTAYNDSGECAPRLLRRFGITEGNRQTLSLGMTLDQLANPGRYRPYDELWKSQSPEGERIDEFVDKEWYHVAHKGETPTRIVEEVRAFSKSAVEAADAAAPLVTRNKEEFERLRNDMRCIQALSESYASKVLAAIRLKRYTYSEDVNDMVEAEEHLSTSLAQFKRLAELTRTTYAFANTMQTAQRRIPVSGGADGKPANYHWTQLLPTYEKELADFRVEVAAVKSGKTVKSARTAVAPLKKAAIRVLSPHAKAYFPTVGSRVFTDKPWEIQALAPELTGLPGIRFEHEVAAAGNYEPVEFECDVPVRLLVGYVQSKDKAWLQPPDMETDALAGENYVSEPLIHNAAVVDQMPAINLHEHRFPAGRHRLVVRGKGSFVILGVVTDDKAVVAPAVSDGAATPGEAPAKQGAAGHPAPASGPATPTGAAGQPQPPADSTSAALKAKPVSTARYRVSACDWMMLKRQKLGAFTLAAELGMDGVELDIGGLGKRETWDNQLVDPAKRQAFIDKAAELGLSVSSIALSGFYAQSFAERPNYVHLVTEAIELAKAMGAKVIFLPLGVQGDLVKHPELRLLVVKRLRVLAPVAQNAGVVIGIETALDAAGEAALLDEVGSPAVKSYFNFSNAIKGGRDLLAEMRVLGAARIAALHCTNSDGVWLENDKAVDLAAVKAQLDAWGWSGWLVIERSRDASDPRNVKRNFGANTAYLKKVFQP